MRKDRAGRKAGVWESGRIGGGVGVGVRETRERKGREIRVLKGWEVGEIRGNYVTMPNTLQSKKG